MQQNLQGLCHVESLAAGHCNIVGTPWDTTQRYRIKATNIESKMSVEPTLEKSFISGPF